MSCGHRSALFLEGIGLTFSQHSLLHLLPHENVGLLRQVAFSDPTWVTNAAEGMMATEWITSAALLSILRIIYTALLRLVAQGDTSE